MSSFSTCVPKITIIWCMLPEIWNRGDIFSSFCAIFCPFTPLLPPKTKVWNKCKKNPWRYYPITHAYHKWRSNDVCTWDIRHNKHSFLSFWAIFCPLILLTTWKLKVLKKWKICLKISSCYACIPQMMIIWCMFPEM